LVPERFIVPQAENQPGLDSALSRIDAILRTLKEQFTIDSQQVTLGGFSQGACLVAEFLKQNPRRYRGAAIMSGGLIGDETEIATEVPGSLSGTPIYLECDENDFHIPSERVLDTADYFTRHGAEVSSPLYQGLGHAIHPDAIAFIESVLKR
jgi:phospholipase/carboxylesterase